jgi:DNA modification methylase
LGDSYTNAGADNTKVGGFTGKSARRFALTGMGGGSKQGSFDKRGSGLKSKNLIGVPWRVAFALQADGWYLRQDIIWSKPNPMPESVTDRCTKSHEYIFLLAKSQKYYFDNDAIKEDSIDPESVNGFKKRGLHQIHIKDPLHCQTRGFQNIEEGKTYFTRNKRSVWTVTTKPFKEAHFATFPLALITPCILAGSRLSDIVLDPFIGSGTTAVAAKKLGRNYMGIDLNPKYIEMAKRRIDRLPVRLDMIKVAT